MRRRKSFDLDLDANEQVIRKSTTDGVGGAVPFGMELARRERERAAVGVKDGTKDKTVEQRGLTSPLVARGTWQWWQVFEFGRLLRFRFGSGRGLVAST